MSVAVKEPQVAPKNLLDTGTRWEHWVELLESFEHGLEAVNNSLARFSNPTDKQRKRSLEGAVFLIANQITKLADYDKHKLKLKKVIDEAERTPKNDWNAKKTSRLMTEQLEEEASGGEADTQQEA